MANKTSNKTTKTFNRPVESEVLFETNDYNIFKRLPGNRKLQKPADMAKIIDSLREHGWIGAPAVVNEYMQVIDGQNRIEVCKRLEIPVLYQIQPGLTIKDCIALNTNKKNWSIEDYVYSYAEQGEDDYAWLIDMHDNKYPSFKFSVIMALATGNGYTTDLKKAEKDAIQSCGIDIDDERKQLVKDTLDYLSKFTEASDNLSGRKFMFYNALIWYRDIPKLLSDGDKNKKGYKVDIKRLITNVNKYANNPKIFAVANTMKGFVYSIQDAYNYGLKCDNRIHIKDLFDQYEYHYSK